jgi:polar amino acid transport system permease protein
VAAAAARPAPGERAAARAAARRRRSRRGAGTAALSTVVVVGVLVALIVNAPGWHDVKETFFSWDEFKGAFPDVLRGFWLDIKLFVIVELVVLVFGLAVALSRSTRTAALFPLRAIAALYTDVFRGVPTLLLIYLVGFGVPALALNGLPTDPLVLGGIALTLSYGAYVAEVYRSGIDSIHPSQQAAALAVGLTPPQALRFVILPQAVRRVVPPLLNDFISLQKDVALVSTLGPLDALREAQIHASQNFNYTPLLAAAVLYLCVTIPLARVVDVLQKREREQ